MNVERIILMISRMFMRKAMNKGVSMVANRGKDPAQMSPEERQQARVARQAAKRARQASKMMRRM